MAKKCKHVKTGGIANAGAEACFCTSPGNPNTSKGNCFKRSNGEGYPVTGWSDGTGWWNLCINGKSLKGVTPSKCDYYR